MIETRAARARRFFFGEDVFISYARPDSGYAMALASALTEHNLSCFVDQWGAPPGLRLPPELIVRLQKASMMVLIGTEWAARSENVLKEVLEFKKTKRPIIPITFVDEVDYLKIQNNEITDDLRGTLEASSWYQEIAGIARTTESNARRKPIDADGTIKPSPQVINRVLNAEGFMSRSRRLRRTFWTTFASLLTMLMVVGIVASTLIVKANQQLKKAQGDLAVAEAKADRAEEKRLAAERASEAAGNARAEAEGKTHAAQADLSATQGELKKASAKLSAANRETLEEQAKAEAARREAVWQGRRASSRELAARADSLMVIDPEASVLLARDAYNLAHTDEAGRTLRHSLLQSHVHAILRGADRGVGIEPKGEHFIKRDADGTFTLRRTDTGEILKQWHQPAGDYTWYQLSPDEKYVVITSQDDRAYAVRLWEWRADFSDSNPRMLYGDIAPDALIPPRCYKGCHISIAFSPDNRYLAGASPRGVVWIWDTTTAERVQKLTVGDVTLRGVRFSPTGDKCVLFTDERDLADAAFLTRAWEGQLVLWDWKVERGVNNPRILRQAGHIAEVAFDPAGRVVAVALDHVGRASRSEPGSSQVNVIELNTGATVSILSGHTDTISSLSFSPSGEYVLTASVDGTARVSKWRGQQRNHHAVILRHGAPVSHAGFDPSGDYVLTSGGDNAPRLWKAAIGRVFGESNNTSVNTMPLAILRGHTGRADARFSGDGRYIHTSSWDGTARIWRAHVERVRAGWTEEDSLNVVADLSPDGRYIVTTGEVGPVRVRRAAGAGAKPEAELAPGAGTTFQRASFSPDGQLVVVGSNSRPNGDYAYAVHSWEWGKEGQESLRFVGKGDGYLNDVSVSHHGGGIVYVAASSGVGDSNALAQGNAGAQNAVRVWELGAAEGAAGPVVLTHPDRVHAAAFSHDRESRYIATASTDGVRIFEWAKGGKPVHTLGDGRTFFRKVAFSPDGRYVVAADAMPMGGALVWEWQTEAGRANPVILRSAPMHPVVTFMFNSVSFSPDSKLVLTAAGDGTVRLWEPRTGKELRIVGGEETRATSASFSRDGGYIVASYSKKVKVYECPECRKEDTLCEIVPDHISLQTILERKVSRQCVKNQN